MNVTISSLIYASFITTSPAFVNNHLSFYRCSFQKISSTLFYNQKSLYLTKSSFTHGLNCIIRNDNQIEQDGEHITVINHNQPYEQTKGPYSITVMDCNFQNYNGNKALILIKNNISIYITHCYFFKCITQNNRIINLQDCHCLTLTHTCASQCTIEGDKGFLYFDCKENDFAVVLYNTIVDFKSNNGNSLDNCFNVLCRFGSHYFRCDNMTGVPCNAYQFEAPQCFSFGMNTVMNCDRNCIRLTGYEQGKCGPSEFKDLTNTNLFSKAVDSQAIFYIGIKCTFKMTIKNSVILYANGGRFFENGQNTEGGVYFIFENCLLNEGVNANDAGVAEYISNNQFTGYDTNHLKIYPHFTSGECKGPENIAKNTDAHACNAGNCIDLACGKTIGFPEGVIPYTTIIYTDLQTATFSPSKKFTNSNPFSESNEFTYSFMFSKSEQFSESNELNLKIYPSLNFTMSNEFTKTNSFSQSFQFSESNIFPSVNPGGNQGGNDKGMDGKTIGIIAGVSAAAAVVAAGLIAFFIIRKRKSLINDIPDMMETKDNAITTNNGLQELMDKDDPFADEFAANNQATTGEEL